MISRSKIGVVVRGRSIEDKTFGARLENPGCGGTEYLGIRLSVELAKSLPSCDVVILASHRFVIDSAPSNLVIIVVGMDVTFDAFSGLDVVLVPESSYQRLSGSTASLRARSIVVWCHHPYRRLDFRRSPHVACVVSVGAWQFTSNSVRGCPHLYIRNLVLGLGVDGNFGSLADRSVERPPRILYMGALVEGKGFHHVAAVWSEVRASLPGASLHVVGGAATYGGEEAGDGPVPAAPGYANRILKLLGDDEADQSKGSVKFYGNLGESKNHVIASCDVAVLNPTGHTEAYSGGILEVLSLGIPVIAPCAFGFYDVMSYFRENAINKVSEIPDKIIEVFSRSADEKERESRRYVGFVKRLEAGNASIVDSWVGVVADVIDGREVRRFPVVGGPSPAELLWWVTKARKFRVLLEAFRVDFGL